MKALEDAKLKAWSAMEDRAFQITVDEVRRTAPSTPKDLPIVKGGPARPGGLSPAQSPAQKVSAFGTPLSRGSSGRDNDELLGVQAARKSCCIIS